MTSFLMLVGILWLAGVVFIAVCMAIIKAIGLLEDTYD